MIKSSSTIIFFDKHRFVAIHSWFENEVIYSLLNHNYFFKIQIEYFSQPDLNMPMESMHKIFFFIISLYIKKMKKKNNIQLS